MGSAPSLLPVISCLLLGGGLGLPSHPQAQAQESLAFPWERDLEAGRLRAKEEERPLLVVFR